MKTRTILFSTLACIAIAMTSCFGSSEEPTFMENDLLGLWKETGTEAYVRFTSEKDDTGAYKYGREWDESEDIFGLTCCRTATVGSNTNS